MSFYKETICHHSQLRIDNYLPKIGKDEVVKNILKGLTSEKKYISSMFFYDEVGSKLFEDITSLPEYYPTRTEKPLIREAACHLCDELKDLDIIEYGSGDCSKISVFLNEVPDEHLASIRYIPVDVSHSAIQESADILMETFQDMEIYGILADFITQANMIPMAKKRLFCLFGGTIGNLTREQASRFCKGVSEIMLPDDIFLLGTDMVKDRNVLHLAYNDSRNVTAEFNRNILNVVNDLIETDIDPRMFEHIAFFNEEQSRIEMYLKSQDEIYIRTPYHPEPISFARGETIHTENSHKFTKESVFQLANAAGLEIDQHYTDDNQWFSLFQLRKKGSGE